MAGRAGEEELRLALVMNGGVSLAVWIGGVVREVARLLSRRSAYGGLADLLLIDPRVDVIAGTSAGGVNGAYLAMALAFHPAGDPLDRAVAGLRDLWVDNGAIDRLLRSPTEASPPSLLDGDGVYFETLRQALAGLRTGTPTSPADVPIDLSLTATLLKGKANQYVDDYGSPVADVSHRARFCFSRARGRDAFAAAHSAAQLAVAARATSSFPGAFEPTFCPVGETAPPRPDMKGVAMFDESRFLIDGGVLDNKPLDVALESIFRQPASRPARRVLAYVVPAPEGTAADADQPDKAKDLPPLLDVVLSSLVEIPSVQSISAQLRALRRHNESVREKRRSRILITRYNAPAQIDSLATMLLPAYRDQRVAEALDYIIGEINEGLLARPGAAPFGRRGRREWLHSALYRLKDRLPWVPTLAPAVPGAETERSAKGWRWGARPLEHLSRIFLDLVVRTQRIAAVSTAPPDLGDLWLKAFAAAAAADRLRSTDRSYWRDQAQAVTEALGTGLETRRPGETAETWFIEAVDAWATSAPARCAELADDIAAGIKALAPIALPLARGGSFSLEPLIARESADLVALLEYFVPSPRIARDKVLARLLAFEVVQETLGGEGTDLEEEVDFIQISGDDDAADGGGRNAGDKLTGIQLAHFGAFYKRSWRANDWTWGRRDAVRRLVRLLLDPGRVKTIALRATPPLDSAAMAARIEAIAVSDGGGASPWPALVGVDRKALEAELAYLDNHWVPVPERLPVATAAIARRLELEILCEEMPLLAGAIEEDRQARLATSSPVAGFARDCLRALGADGTLSPPAAARLQQRCNLGGERLKEEAGTDPATRTAAQALAVGVAALRGGSGIAAGVAGAIGVLRAPTLFFYLFARNLAQGSMTGLVINSAVAAAAAVIVLTALFWGNPYSSALPVSVAAAALIASAFLLVTRRGPWARRIIALLLVAGAFAAVHYGLRTLGVGTWRIIAAVEGLVLFGWIAKAILSRRRTR